MINLKLNEVARTSYELKRNFDMLNTRKTRILEDLQFTESQLNEALDIVAAPPEDVWKLKDYIEEKLEGGGIPFTYLKKNIWHKYNKTW